jgi:hypothetical protein
MRYCDALLACYFDHGTISEVGVPGLTLVVVGHMRGTVLDGEHKGRQPD